jgi:hypothetical protein
VSTRETLVMGGLKVEVVTQPLGETTRYMGVFLIFDGVHLVGSGATVGFTESAAHSQACHEGDVWAGGIMEALARVKGSGHCDPSCLCIFRDGVMVSANPECPWHSGSATPEVPEL